MEIGTAIAIVGTVFSVMFGLVKYFGFEHMAPFLSKFSDLGQKMDNLLNKLDKLAMEMVRMEEGMKAHDKEMDDKDEWLTKVERRVETLESWRLDHVQKPNGK